ncbi:MAG: mercury(II) reductase [Elusimicrobia bacterium]|nr:mercury(II) reductase [Elusimicrobiota bacterium]
MKNFDLIIIGGGAAAFAAAIRADELKARTALINTGLPLGGTCVNAGCVPSKALLHAAELLHCAKTGVPGVELKVRSFDFKKVMRDEQSLVERLRREKYVKVLKALKYVTLIEGKARFLSRNEVEAAGRRLTARKFIIAAGSTATVPPVKGLRETGFITHIEALRLGRQPKELVIVGAGPLGLEFAQLFARFGTKVTVLQRGPSVFPRAEPALAGALAGILSKEGITIRTNALITGARRKGGKKILSYSAGGAREEVSADEILLAAGKTPNTRELGLAAAGVDTDERLAVTVNRHFRTSNPAIFAAGDIIAAPRRLEAVAGREGTLAAENALKGAKLFIDYNTVPYTVFTDPQLAGVGYTEDEQMEKMGVCSCRTVPFAAVPKAIILRRTEGLIKMAIHPETKRILGVHILAPNAGELIAEAMTLIRNKNTIGDVVDSLPMFPTLSEAIKIAALSFTKDIGKLSCCT